MDVRKVALVIFDIGGYTEFIKLNRDSLAHAHEVISQLLEALADQATHPLILNKFEGDAAFLYANIAGDEGAAARDVSRQVLGLFPGFRAKAQELSADRAACPCAACRNIQDLRLKAIIHLGEAAFRKIRQFEEIAGEDVIIVHRLLKNSVAAREYVLMTEPVFRHLDPALQDRATDLVEEYDHLGAIRTKAFEPATAFAPASATRGGKGLRRLAGMLGLRLPASAGR
jgi:hypothetical protein